MRRDDAYLLDMLLSARDAVEFVSGLTYASSNPLQFPLGHQGGGLCIAS